ncbi:MULTISPECIES: hypothetical protein [Corallococcus]|uniref:hypothetical protein n=1 Tax=Corallococcus TaxID=83461 RepID=UPI0011C3A454|nr:MULTISPECIES: hypothetical protein [Corallococcus]
MSLGFEVELNVNVRTQSGKVFDGLYKGVTLFKTQVKPGVNAVIETGTMGGSSTLELVSNVNLNPYDSAPKWKVQVKQLVALVEALSGIKRMESIESFVRQTQHTLLKVSPKRISKDVDERMGASEVPYWQSLFCCCWPSEDQRVAEVRAATLTPAGKFISDDCIQVNFSTNLDYLGECLVKKEHPFDALLEPRHGDAEMQVVASIFNLSLPHRFGREHPRLLAYLFLVLHRLTFEHHIGAGKNRFLFLPRFDLLDLRERLSDTDRKVLGDMDLETLSQRWFAKGKMRLTSVFSPAYQQVKRSGPAPVQNTVEEFLRAALYADFGGLNRKVVTDHIMRVPDSTLPIEVKGADNIVFEGRLGTWTQFAGKDIDLEELSREEILDALKRALKALGNIVTGYDVAPKTKRIPLDDLDSGEGEGDSLLVSLGDV